MINLLQISSNSLLGVINDVLDLSKIESGKFSIRRAPTPIVELCNSVINLLNISAKDKKIALITDIDEALPENIIADSLRLNQILMNLIGNAIKFTQKGSVKLKVEVLDKKGNNLQIRFAVIDTGIGIAKDHIDKIFEVFEQGDEQTTVKFGGTGLGLSIVKNLAQLKGGILKVTSEENKGSTFTFTNWYEVVVETPEDKKSKSQSISIHAFENATILLAEDNQINTFLILKILREWNITVDVVENGQEALDKLQTHNYDLILMDTYMPIMNGLEAIKLIREGYISGKENIPIINFSATVMEADRQKALKAGANDILNKSFDREILYQKISTYLKDKLLVK